MAEAIRKHYHVERCVTDPNDRISIQSATNMDRVMLTVINYGKTSGIDLEPAAAIRFANALIKAAKLAQAA